MKASIVAVVAAAGLLAAGTANASMELATKSGCTACHATDKKVVGPGFKEIAAKYKGDAGAAAKLEAKVKNGGAGVWGQVPMPPNSKVADADIKTLVKFILSQ